MMLRSISTVLFFSLFSFFSIISNAQAPPQGINYQAVARDTSGAILADTTLEVQMEIREGSSTGTSVYREDHTVTTNKFGLFDLVIGQGNPTLGAFTDVNWEQNDFYLSVSIFDGAAYQLLGTMQFMSVPYSMHSATADSSASSGTSLQGAYDNGSTIQLDGTNALTVRDNATNFQFGIRNNGNVGIGTTPNLSQKLRIDGGTMDNALSLFNSSSQPSVIAQNSSTGPAGDFVSNGTTAFRVVKEGAGGGYMDILHNNSLINLRMGSNGSSGLFGTSTGHDLNFMTNSNIGMTLTTDGKVGIGVGAPLANLDVPGKIKTDTIQVMQGSGAAGRILVSDPNGNGTWNDPSVIDDGDWRKNNNYVYNFSDSIGIGTSAPNRRFHITNGSIYSNWTHSGDFTPSIQVHNNSASSYPGIPSGTYGLYSLAGSDGTDYKYAVVGKTAGAAGDQYAIYGRASGSGNRNFGVYGSALNAGTNWAGYFDFGNVYVSNDLRVGTSSLTGKVQVYHNSTTGDPHLYLYEASSDYARIQLTNSSTSAQWRIDGRPNGTTSSAIMNFGYSASGNVMTLKGNNRVGIGTTTPSRKLDVDNGGSIEVDGEYYYETAKTKYYHIGHRDLGTEQGETFNKGYSDYGYFSTGSSGISYYASEGIHLPDGAVITRITAILYDNDASVDAEVQLWRHEPPGIAIYMETLTTSGASTSPQTLSSTSISSATIDNQNYVYTLRFKGDGSNFDIRFHSVKIEYTVDKAD